MRDGGESRSSVHDNWADGHRSSSNMLYGAPRISQKPISFRFVIRNMVRWQE